MKPLEQHKHRKQKGLTIHAEILLDMICKAKDARVMEIINSAIKEEVGSMATLHKAVMLLAELGYISLKADFKDERCKFCLPTTKGKNYHEKL